MNKRIQELVKQANGYWEYGDFNIPHSVYFAETDLEKFAELIVRECMWKIMLRKEEAIDNDWRVDEAMSTAISDISEHFGVEE